MSNYHLVDRETLRGARHGIYFGPLSHVLLRAGDKWLLWTPGHPVWSGTGQPWTYGAASMSISDPRRNGNYRTITRGGRLVKAIADHAATIDAEFGEGISKLLDPKCTVVIGDA